LRTLSIDIGLGYLALDIIESYVEVARDPKDWSLALLAHWAWNPWKTWFSERNDHAGSFCAHRNAINHMTRDTVVNAVLNEALERCYRRCGIYKLESQEGFLPLKGSTLQMGMAIERCGEKKEKSLDPSTDIMERNVSHFQPVRVPLT
jgi:hypothetical protein